MRITIKQLEALTDWINELTHNPLKPYENINGRLKANIGNYHLYQAYGSIALHRMVNEGGGISDIIGLSTKKDLYYQLQAFIKGLQVKGA